jgi:type I protein arginine methyltransferase
MILCNRYGFNMSHIQKLALREPLVDTVNARAVMTSACAFREIDLTTVKVSELEFDVPFSLRATRDDFMHAFICYFDCEFSSCHKKIHFSTGPHATYTHWKQVRMLLFFGLIFVFYMVFCI